ncbi:MAG TPA: hypothetical protein VFM38_05135 [Candidatus Limnocylindrales bacterium]|nr:hypothetical protein [Candidatus Limnocylindrales bacterium]
MNLSVRAAVWAVMRPWIGAAGTLVLSACQAQVASTPGALPSASAAEGPMELTTTADALPPGTYTRSGFEPPITLELDEGWRAVQLLSGFFDVEREVWHAGRHRRAVRATDAHLERQHH